MKLKSLIIFFIFLLSSCTTYYLQFNTPQKAEARYNGIQTIGVNTTILNHQKVKNLKDQQGYWSVVNQSLKTHHLAKLLRKSLIAHLKKFSTYHIIDLEDYRKFQKAYQQLRPVSSEKIIDLDFIIDINFTFDAQQQKGQYQKAITFKNKIVKKRGKTWVTTKNSSEQKVVTFPYNNTHVDLIYYAEVIKTQNGASNVLKNFNGMISQDITPMPLIESVVSEFTVGIASQILKNISSYAKITQRIIDQKGDQQSVHLLNHANLEQAMTHLESLMVDKNNKTASNIYNLALCYEAIGERQLALQMYKEAYQIDQNNHNYLKVIGELE